MKTFDATSRSTGTTYAKAGAKEDGMSGKSVQVEAARNIVVER